MLGGMKPFCQMPVYAESQDDYHDWLDSKINPYGDSALERGETRQRGESIARHHFGIPWPYNRVVGWIEIQVAHDVIKAYLTWTEQKRIRMERREPFS